MNQKLKLGALVVVIIGAAIIFQLQQEKIKRLLAENADLSAQLAQMASLHDTNELLGAQLRDAIETAQANQRELLRLRGQGGRTRQLEQENMRLKAQYQQLERRELESQSAGADEAFAQDVGMRVQQVKTAVVDYYAKYGHLPPKADFIEPTLMSEGLLEDSTSHSSNVRVRTVDTSPPTAPVTAENPAYSLDGGLTNNVMGRFMVEAVLGNVTATAARKLSARIDGERLTSPIGEADLRGRVKYGAIPTNGVGEVHVYLTHR